MMETNKKNSMINLKNVTKKERKMLKKLANQILQLVHFKIN